MKIEDCHNKIEMLFNIVWKKGDIYSDKQSVY